MPPSRLTPEPLDPRDRVTETAFRIDPHLMGVALATPMRRAVALGVDLLLAAIAAEVGGGVLAATAAAVLFFRLAMRSEARHPLRRMARGALALVGALILFGIAVDFADGLSDDDGPDIPAVVTAADSLEATVALGEAEETLAAMGLDIETMAPASVRAALDDLQTASESALTDEGRAEAEALLRGYAEAFVAQDSVALDSLHAPVEALVAGAALDRKDARIDALDDRADALEDENERLSEALDQPSVLRSLRGLVADFGLTLGWYGVYFTLILSWLGGYTPGKRLLGIRVYRLDGRPLSLWVAFERFGGYAAGLATGLLGFAQVLWDANRQGVQDKIAGTVVVRMKDRQTPRRTAEPSARVG